MSIKAKYCNNYFKKIYDSSNSIKDSEFGLLVRLIESSQKSKNKIIFVGNGGSASIASHLTIDCINAANLRAVNFNDPGMITCLSNDYGYENWIGKALGFYADKGDILVLISSSGQSENMLVAAKMAKKLKIKVVTLTGFASDNPLRKQGDLNLWSESNEYNIVEMTHHIWLLSAIDYIIEKNKEI
jgi:D-sedoheptulose 7-phosphate isomerase